MMYLSFFFRAFDPSSLSVRLRSVILFKVFHGPTILP